jgi:hypothetical protein
MAFTVRKQCSKDDKDYEEESCDDKLENDFLLNNDAVQPAAVVVVVPAGVVPVGTPAPEEIIKLYPNSTRCCLYNELRENKKTVWTQMDN